MATQVVPIMAEHVRLIVTGIRLHDVFIYCSLDGNQHVDQQLTQMAPVFSFTESPLINADQARLQSNYVQLKISPSIGASLMSEKFPLQMRWEFQETLNTLLNFLNGLYNRI